MKKFKGIGFLLLLLLAGMVFIVALSSCARFGTKKPSVQGEQGEILFTGLEERDPPSGTEEEIKGMPFYAAYHSEDVTGHSKVRTQEHKIGVGYKLSEGQSIGGGVTKEIADFQDAEAWDRDALTDEQAFVEYKLEF